LWFEDECRVGAKGRTGHRWWVRGERPRGLRQVGYEWAFLFGAVRPVTGEGFALVLPEVSTEAMQAFLDRFAAGLAADAHAVLVLVSMLNENSSEVLDENSPVWPGDYEVG
jgi:hypothetical protein